MQFSQVDDLFYLTNIAGNSYSMFYYLPRHCALLSVYGRYQENHLGVVDAEADKDEEMVSLHQYILDLVLKVKPSFGTFISNFL